MTMSTRLTQVEEKGDGRDSQRVAFFEHENLSLLLFFFPFVLFRLVVCCVCLLVDGERHVWMSRETERQRRRRRDGRRLGIGGQLIGWRSVTCTTCNRRFLARSAARCWCGGPVQDSWQALGG